ncbi:hypothetical protein Hdeb2414_s0018g00536341 [Helianthus debilis subsp. tardiflorus]
MDEISESEDFDYVINEEDIMTEIMDPKNQGCNLAIPILWRRSGYGPFDP